MITSNKTLHDYRQELHTSKSQIKTFLMCPQKYAYQYVMGKEWERKSAALCFGSAIHNAVAEYYLTLANDGKPLSLKEILSIFCEAWTRELKGDVPLDFNGNGPDEMLDLGKRMLEVFIENIQPRTVEAVELPFSVPIVDMKTGEVLPVKLVGAFDLIESDEDDNHTVIELKTAARKWTDGQVETELDSAVYSYAFSEMGYTTHGGETLVRFDVLLKTKKPTLETYFTTKTEKDRMKMLSLISKVLKAIEAGAFYPNYGWQCNGCPFQSQCADDI
jgi:CRISPR/Cas system-associated exonuclease Cas4 (RecB family)